MSEDTEKQEQEQPKDMEAEALAAMDVALESEPQLDEDEIPEPKAPEPEAPKEPEAKDPPKDEAKPEPDAASLNLKGRAAERFAELSATKAEYEPYKAILTTEGVKDAAELQHIIARRKDADFLIETVAQKVGTPEVFGNLMDYAENVGKAHRGDRQAAELAYDMLVKELAPLAKMAGKPVPGVYDPLAEHADLMEAVESGGLDRKHAEELAANRSSTKFHAERQTQTQQAAVETQRVAAEANQQVQQLSAQWMGENPRYKEIHPALNQYATQVMQTQPPGQWAQLITLQYARLVSQLAPPPVTKPTPGAVPMRPTTPRNQVAATPDDPLAAFDMGYEQAVSAGY